MVGDGGREGKGSTPGEPGGEPVANGRSLITQDAAVHGAAHPFRSVSSCPSSLVRSIGPFSVLTSATFTLPPHDDAGTRYPFTVPAVRATPALAFHAPVTFFVGENGSGGKSTWLEGIAAAAGLPAVGSDDVAGDSTLAAARALARQVKLAWRGARATRGFFLRAEDFFGHTKWLAAIRATMLAELGALESEYERSNRSAYALGLAQGPLRASLADMERRYGVDLDANSHGQSFLTL